MDSQIEKIQKAWQKYQEKMRNIRKRRNEVLHREDQQYTDKKLKEIRKSLDL